MVCLIRRGARVASALALLAGCARPEPSSPPAAPEPVAFAAPAPRLRRLTGSQYQHTVTDVLGEGLVLPAALEPDVVAEGSVSVGASSTGVSARGVEQFQRAAYDLAEQVLRSDERRAAVVPCAPKGAVDVACVEQFVDRMGRRLYRRPLRDEERALLTDIATTASSALDDFYQGLEHALAAMLQAPDFLYRVELGEDDPARPGARRYDAFELAARLSFLLWDSGPDDALLDAAARGALDTREGLSAEVDRLLASPKSRRGLRAFVADWFRLDELDRLSKDTVLFPSFGSDFGPSAREEVLRLAEAIVFDQEADFRDLLVTRDTFVNRRLAALYGVQFPLRDAPRSAFVPVSHPESSLRRGLLGTAAVLAGNAHPTSTSVTRRGLFIREVLLCGTVPPPPVGLNTAVPAPTEAAPTLRERLTQHLSNSTCASCHSQMDPLGLGLEHFDAIGRQRATDHGAPIDASSEEDGRRFVDARGLAQVVRDHPELPRCLVRRVYRHAQGRVETSGEREELEALQALFAHGRYRVRPLLKALVMRDAFRRTSNVEEAP